MVYIYLVFQNPEILNVHNHCQKPIDVVFSLNNVLYQKEKKKKPNLLINKSIIININHNIGQLLKLMV